jgi:ankyrin repeat protein
MLSTMKTVNKLNEWTKFQRCNSLTDLHDAVLKNCEKNAHEALANGVPIDLTDHRGQTALHYASERGFVILTRLLLSYNAQVNSTDSNGISALLLAASEGHVSIVLTLLKHGACPNKEANDQTTALYHASYNGHHNCVYHLVRYKAAVNCAKNSGASPLFVAARNGHHRIVKHLLKHGADPTRCQTDLRSPLHTALLYNQLRCARLLLRDHYRSLIEKTDIYDSSHLHYLAKKGSLKSARLYFHYLKHSGIPFNLKQTDRFGNTPLHISAWNRRTKFSQYLIAKGFDADQTNLCGWTPNTIAATYENENIELKVSPKHYLHHLIATCRVRYTPEDEQIRFEVENYVKMLASKVAKSDPLFCSDIICSGSYYEGTRVILPDEFDYLINLSEIERLCTFIDSDNDPAGFGRLYPLDTPEAHEKLASYLEPTTECLSSEKLRKRFYYLLTSARAQVICKETLIQFKCLKFEWTSGDKRCGTTIQAEWHGEQYAFLPIKIDVVPCMTVTGWPRTANIASPLSTPQFHVIARSPKSDQTFLWRVSTSSAEVAHFKSLLPEIQNGYLSLKCLRSLLPSEHTVGKLKYTAEELITSYMFKTEALYEAQRCPHREQWINGSLIHRVSSILKRLDKHIQMGLIKSFYIKDYNIIDKDDYTRLRSFEIQYIRQLRMQLTEKVKAMNRQAPRRYTYAGIETIVVEHEPRLRVFSVTS